MGTVCTRQHAAKTPFAGSDTLVGAEFTVETHPYHFGCSFWGGTGGGRVLPWLQLLATYVATDAGTQEELLEELLDDNTRGSRTMTLNAKESKMVP